MCAFRGNLSDFPWIWQAAWFCFEVNAPDSGLVRANLSELPASVTSGAVLAEIHSERSGFMNPRLRCHCALRSPQCMMGGVVFEPAARRRIPHLESHLLQISWLTRWLENQELDVPAAEILWRAEEPLWLNLSTVFSTGSFTLHVKNSSGRTLRLPESGRIILHLRGSEWDHTPALFLLAHRPRGMVWCHAGFGHHVTLLPALIRSGCWPLNSVKRWTEADRSVSTDLCCWLSASDLCQ